MKVHSEPVFIIAEAGVNHNGHLDTALRLVEAAKEAGADAVKFQTFRADRIVGMAAEKAAYQKRHTSADETQYHMLKRLELSEEAHYRLLEHCRNCQIEFLSTPFDYESADFLDKLGISRFKIPSGEITNIPFLKYIAEKGRPVILSTGASDIGEVATAITALEDGGAAGISLLHCVSQYPAPFEDINLKAMNTLANVFQVPVGYSDHTLGIEIAIAAVALGARIIEKHFTLDRKMPGPDHQASIEPPEFQRMVLSIRHVEAALGDGVKRPAASEREIQQIIRKSLVASVDLRKGEVITPEMLLTKRPGTGIPPSFYNEVIGLKLIRPVKQDTVLKWEDFKE
ncbi:MAG TPA: N-acetylneuraminate synthase [Bacillota bacterium]|nr:N-acetylneuraminate synthase [Bacillota bacterium]